ncbi:MAG: hypothetical protein HY998_07365 [candidate division NC10 bacterium]|nr:hypothetical protein [candidate division NC10 bacterium]
MASQSCAKCGKELPLGGLKYLVKIEVYADFDGYIAEEPLEDAELKMRELLEDMAEIDPEKLERDVYWKELHLLCKDCRDRFLANPLGIPLPEAWGG